MKLLRYRVTGFRSVVDSDWIETDDVTALIGVNESGKTNLIVPLWKLNPAGPDGKIDAIADYPRSRYGEIRALADEVKPAFIAAEFELDKPIIDQLVALTSSSADNFSHAVVQRRFDGKYVVSFPKAKGAEPIGSADLATILGTSIKALEAIPDDGTPVQAVRAAIIAAATQMHTKATAETRVVPAPEVKESKAVLEKLLDASVPKVSAIATQHAALMQAFDGLISRAARQNPNQIQEARTLIVKNLPKFIYYSNYGNLDSEIYLPHVIENVGRVASGQRLGERELAKARTLRVLFTFVNLKPEEIHELGKAIATPPDQAITAEQIAAGSARTKEREILLTSASTTLTQRFRDWWKQGDYRFRFQADGDHFRIWVSDDRRPEEIELEGRSTGLQWFFSFYLVFLVEMGDAHKNAILLLDEPGLSLHPLAQKDLSRFFESLGAKNQLIYTSHSPFLLDANRLDQVKAVFTDDSGVTKVSSNLRAGEADSARTKSVFAVHAALGYAMSDPLFIGGLPVIVEGTADQSYLYFMKSTLIARGRIDPPSDLVFVPAGGAKGISTVASILSMNDGLAPVILDADKNGLAAAKSLKENLYAGQQEKVVTLDEILNLPGIEIEDLMPGALLARVASRLFRGKEADFDEVYKPGELFVTQFENFAAANSIAIEKPGWKVQLAKEFTQRMRRTSESIDDKTLGMWEALFLKIITPAK